MLLFLPAASPDQVGRVPGRTSGIGRGRGRTGCGVMALKVENAECCAEWLSSMEYGIRFGTVVCDTPVWFSSSAQHAATNRVSASADRGEGEQRRSCERVADDAFSLVHEVQRDVRKGTVWSCIMPREHITSACCVVDAAEPHRSPKRSKWQSTRGASARRGADS